MILKTRGARFFLVSALFFFTACSTFKKNSNESHNAFENGDYELAAQLLEKKSKEDSKDQLLYLLDRATALQLAGHYEESSKDFILADRLSDVKDYTSLSAEAASLIVNDSVRQYPGEDFEKVLINAINAINFALMGDFEGARVETRRVNQKLYRYKYEAKRDYEQNPFAYYLAAVMWEASGDLDSAYIDYKSAAELAPQFRYVKKDVIRLAKRLKRADELKKWQQEFGEDIPVPTAKEEKTTGEVVLIFQQGKTAMKEPHPNAPSFPKFYARHTLTRSARMVVDGMPDATEISEPIYSVSQVAIKTLDDAYATLVAKRVGGVAAKYIISDQVAQKNRALGTLTWLALNVVDQADTRHWSTLPETLQFARLRLPPGEHTIKVIGLDASQNPTGEEKTFTVKILPRRITLLNWRSLK